MSENCKECGQPLKKTQKAFCSNECKFSNEEYNASRSPSISNDENKKAVCPICGYESDDYKNISGSLTKHQNKEHGGKEIEFEIEEKEKQEKLHCPKCKWTTTDTENKSGAFTVHVDKKHEGVLSFVKDHPEHKHILPTQKRKEKKRKKEEGVECQICGKHFDKLTNTHLKKHGITPTEYKIKYESETYSETHYKKCLNHYQKNLEGNGHTYVSEPEKEIAEFVRGFENIETSVRRFDSISELDILIPKKEIAIEFNGLPYHAEKFNGKETWDHHLKYKECQKMNIELIQIFGDQWKHKKKIVKNRLKHRIGKSDGRRIGARKCHVKEVSNSKKRHFLENNHLRGSIGSSVSLGLVPNESNEIVALMTFGHSRSDKEFELSRFAIKSNHVVHGAGGKLFSHFLKKSDPSSVVTYLDLTWPNERLYPKLGFEFDGLVDPSYTYTKNYRKRIHKSNFTKSKIKSKYPKKYDENLTEWGNMQMLGYDRIWDCGKFRYVWENSNKDIKK